MNDDEPSANSDQAVKVQIQHLRQDHQDLDAAIQALADTALPDMLLIARLKRKKLQMRDQIAQLEDRLTPDIIA
jgi:hypothetical protein